MIYAIYIGAAAVVGLLIGFVALSIVWLRKTVSNNIRSKTVGLISVYDELLEERSQALAELEQESEEGPDGPSPLVEHKPDPAAEPSGPAPLRAAELLRLTERSGGAAYRDRAVGSVYLKIRENFSFRLEEILPLCRGTSAGQSGPAQRLLAQMEFDTVYRLSTLPSEQQTEILRQTLPTDGLALLDSYQSTHTPFLALGFYDYLKSAADMEPRPACLRVPAGIAAGKMTRSGVRIVPDREICEGFQLEKDRLLYDYSIRARELS